MPRFRVKRRPVRCSILPAVLLVLFAGGRTGAYIEAPLSLGSMVFQSSNIVVLEIEKVDTERNTIHYRKTKDLKGRHYEDKIVHRIGQKGFEDREWQTVMKWAKPGKTAVFFHNGRASETCIGKYWYQCYDRGSYWGMSHGEPFLLRTFAGRTPQLTRIVEKVEAGEEAVAPCLVDGNDEELKSATARVQRLRVGLSLRDYNPQRDFVGWGGGELEELRDMPGFSHIAMLPRVDPFTVGLSVADYDRDGKLDVALFGETHLTLVRNETKTFTEVPLPGAGGARSAAWSDHDGDGRLDLLVATANGVRLLAGTANEPWFVDVSRRLVSPRVTDVAGVAGVTSAAWIDANQDGWPDVLLASGFGSLHLLVNEDSGKGSRRFRDAGEVPVPEEVFDDAGPNAGPGDHLVLGDVNGDGATDVFYCAGRGALLLGGTGEGALFKASTDHDIRLDTRGVGPAFGDRDGDGDLDLFIPSGRFGRLWVNDGKGRFHDATIAVFGVVDSVRGRPVSATWGDLDCDDRQDLLVSFRQGPNRIFLNRGERMIDGSSRLGLDRRVFQSQAAGFADFDGDGDLDVVLANEGEESCILLAASRPSVEVVPVDVLLPVDRRLIGATLRVLSVPDDGAEPVVVTRAQVGGLYGRGSQAASRPRVGLATGSYRIEVRCASGETLHAAVDVGKSHVVVAVK